MFDYDHLPLPGIKVLFSLRPDRLLFGILILSCFLKPSTGPSARPARPSLELYIMFLFGALCTLSWFISGVDFGNTRYKWLSTLYNLVYVPFGVYFVARRTSYDRARITKLLWVIAALGTYLSITGLGEHFHIRSLVWPKYILDPTVGIQAERVRGPFVTSVAMGEWLITTFMSAAILIPLATGLKRLYLYVLMMAATASIYFTDQRSVWVSFALLFLVGLFFGGPMHVPLKKIAALILIVFLAGIGGHFSIFGPTLFSRRQNTVDYRYANFSTALKMGLDNFWTGVGYGRFPKEWSRYFGTSEADLIADLGDGNHNTYLGLFAETGIFGPTLYVSLLTYLAYRCASLRRRLTKDSLERQLTILALGMIGTMLIEANFSDLRGFPTINTIVFLFLAVVTTISATPPSTLAQDAMPTTVRSKQGLLYTAPLQPKAARLSLGPR